MRFDWDEMPDLNITPLTDVMLVLMAILMISVPTIVYQEMIELPEGSKSRALKQPKSLTIHMDRDATIYFGKERFEMATFADIFLNKTATLDKSQPVFIRADKQLRYEKVIYLLKSIKAAGFHQVSLVTE